MIPEPIWESNRKLDHRNKTIYFLDYETDYVLFKFS